MKIHFAALALGLATTQGHAANFISGDRLYALMTGDDPYGRAQASGYLAGVTAVLFLCLSACAQAERASESASFERRLADENACVQTARLHQRQGLGAYRTEYVACMSSRGWQQTAGRSADTL